MIKIIFAAIAVMIANIVLGTNLASLKGNFDKEKLKSGIFKILGIVLGFLFILVAGYLTQDITIANVMDIDVNILKILEIGCYAAITKYGIESISKIFKIIGLNIEIKEKIETSMISIPETNIIKREDV